KFLIFAVALVACVCADVSELADPGYDYPQPAPPAPALVETYIPPAPPVPPAPRNEYIPPAPIATPADAYIPPALAPAVEEIEQPAQDGYRYKTVRRRVFRHRN
ncbi:hypothetical protein KR222_008429, partial [Zaprionus bogoriensis]